MTLRGLIWRRPRKHRHSNLIRTSHAPRCPTTIGYPAKPDTRPTYDRVSTAAGKHSFVATCMPSQGYEPCIVISHVDPGDLLTIPVLLSSQSTVSYREWRPNNDGDGFCSPPRDTGASTYTYSQCTHCVTRYQLCSNS
jgi:hypothetical protein